MVQVVQVVQVVRVEPGREIGWGSSTVEAFRDRLEDVREAVVSGARAVAGSLPGLPAADGWRLGEVSGSFGICLTAEAGVILTQAHLLGEGKASVLASLLGPVS